MGADLIDIYWAFAKTLSTDYAFKQRPFTLPPSRSN